jgi:pyruvate/2-oxoglutarate dehydrogenase complex dihydrolipoamide acyltransferase (E2) component
MIYRLAAPPVEGVEEFRVLQWFKTEGEEIASDQLLVELETDKAIVEVRASRKCVLRKISVNQGEWAPTGQAVAWFSDRNDEVLETGEPQDFLPQWEIT